MDNIKRISHWWFIVLPVVMSPAVMGQEKLLNVGLSVQELWDSNFSRSPDDQELDERITLTSANVRLDKKFSRQRFTARWKGSHYQHDERTDLDTDVHTGQAIWQGEWGSKVSTNLEWVRDAYAVDRLEFFGKDVVARNDVKAKIGYGSGRRLSFYAGARDTQQTHSNDLRESMDFEEKEAFIETQYQTANKSLLLARFKSGERTYPNPRLDMTPGDFDFDYDQAELEAVWTLSPKTKISTLFAAYARDGLINDGTGSLAAIDVDWEPTPKITIKSGYAYKEPAIGEISDTPTEVQSVFLSAAWQLTEKFNLETGVQAEQQQYGNISPSLAREEKVYKVVPLAIAYEPVTYLSLRLETGWLDRQSPLLYRDYSAKQANLGLFFRY